MDKKEEFRHHLKAVRREFENSLGRHLSKEELIDYQQGRLAETAREEAQSHLVQCDVCLAAFKDVSDFFEPAREGEEPVSKVEVGRAWQTFWQRVQPEEKAATGASGLGRAGFWLNRRTTLALAGSLVAAIVLTGAWALWLRQENQQLNRRLQSEQSGGADRLRQLEQENRRAREQAGTLKQEYASELAALRQPQLNAPIFDILSRKSIQRSGGGTETAVVEVPRTTRNFTLILNGEGQPEYPDYVIEILDSNDQLIWRGEGLRRSSDRNFVLTLDRAFLSEGPYHLKLYGQKGGRSKGIAEYAIVLRFAK